MSQLTESQLRRAIRAQIIRALNEGAEPEAETKHPLVKVLNHACDIFSENAPQPEGSDGRKPRAELQKHAGKVRIVISGGMGRDGKQYPLVKKGGYNAAKPVFESEDALGEAMITAVRDAFYEFEMQDYYRTVKFGALQKEQLPSGLFGYILPTSIPADKRTQEGEK